MGTHDDKGWILVIGGTGVVGAPIVRELDRAGWTVRVMSRNASGAREKLGPRVDLVRGDANRVEDVERAMAGCRAVLICVSDLLDPYLDLRVTQTVVELASQLGTERIGLISGASVAPERRWFPMIDAKFQAEEHLKGGRIPWVILRLTWTFESLARFVQGNRASILGRQPATIHPLAGADIGRMVSRAFEVDEAVGNTFTLHGAVPYTLRECLEEYCARLHPKARVANVPFWLLSVVAAFGRDRGLRAAIELMKYFDALPEYGDPTEANRILGAPTLTLEQWAATVQPDTRPATPPVRSATMDAAPEATARVRGMVAPGFEEVRIEFERNFAERGEIGAAVAAYWRGEKVVDLWGGCRTPEGEAPWNEDTMVVVMSTTKGLAALTLAVANARGWLDYDAPVARYWPEFAQNGKGAVTVRQLLGHEAGLVLLDEELTVEKMRDLDGVARILARQKPAWPPGTRHGYHTMTIGLYMQELIRHADPTHRTFGRFFQDEVARPLGLDFYIGLPKDIPDDRIAAIQPLSRWRALRALLDTPPLLIAKVLQPRSLLRRSFILTDLDWTHRRSLEIELPAGNGVGTARALARAYAAFAEGGAEIGITPETFARVTAPPVFTGRKDAVLGVPSCFSLGFMRPAAGFEFGSSPRTVGAPGAGGSFAFADPDAHLGYAYVMNKLDFWLSDDPREKPLRDAVYRGIAGRTARARGRAESDSTTQPAAV